MPANTSPITSQPKIPLIQQTQQNDGDCVGGTLINSGTQAHLRPQFRRQGSNFGGATHVSPMAIMVPTSKVDYSVTKGGLRLWALLLVFIVLCSSFYTLFSTKELAELAVEINGDENSDFDGDINDEGTDEVATHNRRAGKDTILSRAYTSQTQSLEENGKAHQPIQNTFDSPIDTNLDENNDLEKEEEARLAKLQAKAERKKRKTVVDEDAKKRHEDYDDVDDAPGDDVDDKDGTDNESDEDETPKKARILRRLSEHVKEIVEDKTMKKQAEKQERLRQARGRRRRVEVLKEEEEVDERREEIVDNNNGEQLEDDEQLKDEEEAKGGKRQEKRETGEGEEMKMIKESKEGEAEVEGGGEKEEEKATAGAEYEIKGKLMQRKIKPRRKIQLMSFDERPERKCKRKNCPPKYDRHPRRSLLKQIPHSMLNHIKEQPTMSRMAEMEEESSDNKGQEIQEGDESTMNEEFDDDSISDLDAFRKEKLGDRTAYRRHAITNRDDHKYRDQLDRADYLVEKHDYHSAIAIFENILRINPDSPRAHFGLARAYDIRSEIEFDHSFLDMAINEYQEVLDINDTPDALFIQAAYRLIDRARFRGALHRVLQAQRSLIDRYPGDLQLHSDQGLTFLMMGREDDARKIFENILKISPANGVAQAYYGYILKLSGDLENGVLYMRKGLRAAGEVIADPRFYYHFGDALMRLGRNKEAHRVYTTGTKVGIFLSPYQRSLYNVKGLTARPWWSVEQTSCSQHLKAIERQWLVIREEAMAILITQPHLFIPEHEELVIDGQWLVYHIYSRNLWNSTNCLKAPKTCDIIRMFKNSSQCLKSEVNFSLLTSGTRVWPHCGYSNCRLQAHLGLIVPSEARLRVANEVRGWKTGHFITFDDSFEHELWFVGASASKYRLVLKLDLWHPEVDRARRTELQSVE